VSSYGFSVLLGIGILKCSSQALGAIGILIKTQVFSDAADTCNFGCRNRMHKFILSIAGLALITGCASSVPISTQNGKLGHAVNCSGGNMGHCYQKASTLCEGRGYDILNQKDKAAGFLSGADKRMVIECRENRESGA